MDIKIIIDQIDSELAKLSQARAILSGTTANTAKRGRRIENVQPAAPAKSRAPKTAGVPAKGEMSSEGRARIAAAQKLRWAKSKRTAKKAAKATISA